MQPKETAVQLFNCGYNCSQSVLAAYCEQFGINQKAAKAIAAGFGAGIGKMQKTCGAVTGGIMVIGCKYFNDSDKAVSKASTYQKTKELINKFIIKNDSIECLDLLGVDINTEEGKKIAHEKNLFNTICVQYVKDVCQIIDENL